MREELGKLKYLGKSGEMEIAKINYKAVVSNKKHGVNTPCCLYNEE